MLCPITLFAMAASHPRIHTDAKIAVMPRRLSPPTRVTRTLTPPFHPCSCTVYLTYNGY